MSITAAARLSALALLSSAALAAAWPQATGPGRGATLTVSLASGTVLRPGEVVEITVEATNPTPDRVDLVLLNPPSGCVFTQDPWPSATPVPVTPGTGSFVTARGRARWLVASNSGGIRRLTFRAIDRTHAAQSLSTSIDPRVDETNFDWHPDGMLLGDVTGDGIVDTVAPATNADVAGVADVGAIYVWKGRATPAATPDATLVIPGATPLDLLGLQGRQGLQLADVTGDGVLDVVSGSPAVDVGGVVNAGAVYVWAGGAAMQGAPPPLATLTVPGALTLDGLGDRGIRLLEVTGDRVLDLVVAASVADAGLVPDTGAIHVWAGGPTLVGALAPLATLRVPGAAAYDRLGWVHGADVTGDSIQDLVVLAPDADVGSQQGAVYVWKGGPTLVGALAPLASLAPGPYSGLGFASGRSLEFGDVTGNGIVDLVVAACNSTVAGQPGAGAVFVWSGGPTLPGTPAPIATLAVSGAGAYDFLAYLGFLLFGGLTGKGLQLADVSGDGVLDVIAGASNADVAGVSDVGAVFVWAGGATLAGTPLPLATLSAGGMGDQMGEASCQSLQLVDVTGDGTIDVVAAARLADVAGTPNAGAIYVWSGGPSLAGSPAPLATLTVPGAIAQDQLAFLSPARDYALGFQLVDVTGDTIADVVAGAEIADAGGIVDAGAVYVWAGGAALAGAVAPLATLTVPGATKGDQLGSASGQPIQVVDVTGDRILDVVVGASHADVAGKADVGAIYVWSGGATLVGPLAPLATLRVTVGSAGDGLGNSPSYYAQGIVLGDVTGDGTPDVVADAYLADIGARTDVGVIYVWKGGPTLAGTPGRLATLKDAASVAGDQLGLLGQGVKLADVTGDGVLDVIAGAQQADVGGRTDAGALYEWSGGAALPGFPAPVKMTVPGAASYDQLGS